MKCGATVGKAGAPKGVPCKSLGFFAANSVYSVLANGSELRVDKWKGKGYRLLSHSIATIPLEELATKDMHTNSTPPSSTPTTDALPHSSIFPTSPDSTWKGVSSASEMMPPPPPQPSGMAPPPPRKATSHAARTTHEWDPKPSKDPKTDSQSLALKRGVPTNTTDDANDLKRLKTTLA